MSGNEKMLDFLRASKKPRKQCAKCPWRKDVDPYDIPDGYDPELHADLKGTIAEPADPRSLAPGVPLHIMACHETYKGKERPCVGWLVNQLGPGNNLALRLAIISGRIDADIELAGEQHERFEDTLPRIRHTVP